MQPGMYRYRPARGTDTPAVYALLSIMGIVFIVDWIMHSPLTLWLAWPVDVAWLPTLQLWRPFTFPFAHGENFGPFITDAIILYFFGGSLERAWGSGKFLVFFFATGIVPGLVLLVLSPWLRVSTFFYGMVGSFAALSVAFAVINPGQTVLLYFVIPIQARWIAVLGVAWEIFGRGRVYGGPIPALLAVSATVAFAYVFSSRRFSLSALFSRRGGPSLKDRMERWQQKRRMREWQRRVARVERPEDLFKDQK